MLYKTSRHNMALRGILYGYWSSSCTWRVRAALQFKGIDYEVRPIKREELKNPDFLRVNPSGRVPVFVHGKSILTESLSIIEFLEEEYPGTKKLLHGDSFNRAVARSIALNIVAGIQPLQSKQLLAYVDAENLNGKEWAQNVINQGFTTLEKRLQRTAGKYCVGDDVSIADCCLVPQVYNAVTKFEMELTPFPTIQRINDALEKMPAFQRAHANAQPDTPTEIKVNEENLPKNVASASCISN